MIKVIAALGASLTLALGIHAAASETFLFVDVFAGWIIAALVFAIGHFALIWTGKFSHLPLLPLIAIPARLFCLIIIYLVVLISGVFTAGPFTTGMLTSFLMAGWLEIKQISRGGLSRRVSR